MTKQIYLHVGFHKTGTTSLQRSLKLHEKDLLDQNLEYITGTGDNSHAIAWSLSRRVWGWKNFGGSKINKKVFERAIKRIKTSRHNILLSSEFFTEINQEQMQILHSTLHGCEVRIIFTWRPLQNLIISSYQQYLKYGVKADLELWLHSILDNPPESKLTPTFWKRHMHGEVVNKWGDVFGFENISLIVVSEFDRSFIFRSFEKTLNLRCGTLSAGGEDFLNRSLNSEEIALLLKINHIYPKNSGWDSYENSIRLGAFEKLSIEAESYSSVPKLKLPPWSKSRIEDIQFSQNQILSNLGIEIIGDFQGAQISNVEYGENLFIEKIDLERAALAVIGAGRQSLKGWRTRELAREVSIRLLRKFKLLSRA